MVSSACCCFPLGEKSCHCSAWAWVQERLNRTSRTYDHALQVATAGIEPQVLNHPALFASVVAYDCAVLVGGPDLAFALPTRRGRVLDVCSRYTYPAGHRNALAGYGWPAGGIQSVAETP